jgi:polyhydroxyalkanoate synthase
MTEHAFLATMLRTSDRFRRSVGLALDQMHLGPLETVWDAVLSEPGFALRHYGAAEPHAPPVLVVPAPIKRPYIFDLMPPVSVVQRLLEADFSVYVMDWREEPHADWGLAEYASAWVGAALAAIAERHESKPVLIGHSIGGTFAAIFTAREPERVQKLLLLAAPLRFGKEAGDLAPIVGASLPGNTVAELAGGVPGSLLDVASCAGAPEEFVAGRWQDAFASLLEPEAFLVHQRVIRWTLDEFAQPVRLFSEIVEQLYRADAFARGELRLAGKKALPEALTQLPVATVIDETSRVVPPASSLGPLSKPEVFTYKPEVGVALQHVGPLVGRRAHRELWPRLVEWIK